MDANKIKDELTSIAESRLGYYRELVKLADAQRDLLVKSKHSELVENLKKHDPILVEIGRLDKREESLTDQVIGMGTDSTHHRLLRETAETAEHLARLTRINAQLLENAKEFVAFSIGVICKTASESASGGSSDAFCDSNAALLLDMKV